MGDVKLAVKVILVACDAIVLELVVVDPDVDGLVKSQRVLALGRVAEMQVANNNVVDSPDADTTTSES